MLSSSGYVSWQLARHSEKCFSGCWEVEIKFQDARDFFEGQYSQYTQCKPQAIKILLMQYLRELAVPLFELFFSKK